MRKREKNRSACDACAGLARAEYAVPANMPLMSTPEAFINGLQLSIATICHRAQSRIPTFGGASAGASFTPSPAIAILSLTTYVSISVFLSSGRPPARTSSIPKLARDACACRSCRPVAMDSPPNPPHAVPLDCLGRCSLSLMGLRRLRPASAPSTGQGMNIAVCLQLRRARARLLGVRARIQDSFSLIAGIAEAELPVRQSLRAHPCPDGDASKSRGSLCRACADRYGPSTSLSARRTVSDRAFPRRAQRQQGLPSENIPQQQRVLRSSAGPSFSVPGLIDDSGRVKHPGHALQPSASLTNTPAGAPRPAAVVMRCVASPRRKGHAIISTRDGYLHRQKTRLQVRAPPNTSSTCNESKIRYLPTVAQKWPRPDPPVPELALIASRSYTWSQCCAKHGISAPTFPLRSTGCHSWIVGTGHCNRRVCAFSTGIDSPCEHAFVPRRPPSITVPAPPVTRRPRGRHAQLAPS